MHHCRLLLRKVEGLTWPTLEMGVGDQRLLERPFMEAGIAIEVVLTGPDLTLLVSGRPFGKAELRSALRAVQRTVEGPENGWTAVVLLVPRLCGSAIGWAGEPLGVTFGAEDGAREACAVAAGSIGDDPRKLLRTLAHELGHLFNLGHPGEGTEPFDADARNTLMVPSRRLEPPGRWPGPAAFRFTERQRAWLRYAPEPYVRPGGLPFGAKPAGGEV